MEAELLTKIIAGGGGATTAIWFIYYILKTGRKEAKEAIDRIEKMHTQGMTKFDRAIDTLNNLATTLAVHAKELEYGDKRFVKIEEDILLLRKSDHEIRNKMHDIRNKMVTQETLREMVK